MLVRDGLEFLDALVRQEANISLLNDIVIPREEFWKRYSALVSLPLRRIELYGNGFSIRLPFGAVYEFFGRNVSGSFYDTTFVFESTSNYALAHTITDSLFKRCTFQGTFTAGGKAAGVISWRSRNLSLEDCAFRLSVFGTKVGLVSVLNDGNVILVKCQTSVQTPNGATVLSTIEE